ncbi:MAG: sigma-54-dependent Fis family transcriptional regulator [Cryomorphaceae bacterium]|nr:sigma-54-dependent Fis family transcriptional regulator [Cryomorphaceae bacterium]
MSFKIFIVEDDPWYGQLLVHTLSLNPDYEPVLFGKAKDLLDNLYKNPDLICMDFGLPDMDGHRMLKEIQNRNAQIPVVVISGQEEISVAVDLLKLGAKDYIIKDEHTKDMLWKSIIQIRENLNLKQEVLELKEQLENKFSFERSIIGQSNALRKTFGLLQKAITSNINVSITGETGTGKEVYAKAIHYNSDRRSKPFIAVNMAAIPKDLAESELFGHEKGAFTGAISAKAGKFEEARGGTLFLDEIGDLDPALQSKLLRVLQEREVVRVGGSKTIPVDFRLIVATHKKMEDEVKNGNFREDLFFRIVGLPIHLPPLRDRDNDVVILGKHFIGEFAKQNKTKPPTLSNEASSLLKGYAFPGNVRELKSVIDLACVMCNGEEILAEDLVFHNLGSDKVYSNSEKTLKEYEAEIIEYYLNKYEGNVMTVAEKLDIGKSKIYNLLKNGVVQAN